MAFNTIVINAEEIRTRRQPILMHVDLDMFFAAVEIRHNPELKGKPMIVGNPSARLNQRGVVLTASYEARSFGVHSGMSMNKALKLCPTAEISNSARKQYKPTSNRIMNFLKQLQVPMKVSSIDEAYLDITHKVENFQEARMLAEQIQEYVKIEERIGISIGVAPTFKIAKMASEVKKPFGITIVSQDDVRDFFQGLPLKAIPGIGKATMKKFEKHGYKNCDQLFQFDQRQLLQMFGLKLGNYLYRVFNAETSTQIKPKEQQKSISHESTFHGSFENQEKYNQIVNYLFTKSYNALRQKGLQTKTVNAKIRFNGYETIIRTKSTAFATDEKEALLEIVKSIIFPYFEDKRGLRLLGVGFGQLERKDETQQTLQQFF